MQNRAYNQVLSPNATFETQLRRQGDPNLIFVNAIPTSAPQRDHPIHLPSHYNEQVSQNPFHDSSKSDRSVTNSFQTFAVNQVEHRRTNNTPEGDVVDTRVAPSFGSKSIQNKYGLGVRILEKTPRNSNTTPEQPPLNRNQITTVEHSRLELRQAESSRTLTPVKSPHHHSEPDRVVVAVTSNAPFSSPTPGSALLRDYRVEQHLGHRHETYVDQSRTTTPQSRIQGVTRTPFVAESARTISSNGANIVPQHIQLAPQVSHVYYAAQSFSKPTPVVRTLDVQHSIQTINESELLNQNLKSVQQSKSIIVKSQNINEPTPASYRSPKTSYNQNDAQMSPIQQQSIPIAHSAPHSVPQEVISLTLEGIGTYEGNVRNNALNGYGKLMDVKGRVVFEGEFVGNQFEGIGVLYNYTPSSDRGDVRNGVVVPDNWTRYEGLFHANKMNGNGRLFYGDGSHFAGEFDDDAPNGYGVLQVVSGESMRGTWRNGTLDTRM